jgi:nucleoside-diphosphate-sugar epimerase
LSAVLVTGASGFLGSRLVVRLEQDGFDVLGLSRKSVPASRSAIQGSFVDPADLRKLDAYDFDRAVHLAAVLPEADERTSFEVNAVGTSTLLRYLAERGCKHIVVASSIAATGCMSPSFCPPRIPIIDDYPCEAVDAYGMSKALMESVCAYFARKYSELEIEVLRIGVVRSERVPMTDDFLLERSDLPFLLGGLVAIDDVVDALAAAIEYNLGSGMRVFNVVGPTAPTRVGVRLALRLALGDSSERVDTSDYDSEERETSALYATDAFERAYGLRLTRDVAGVYAAGQVAR